MGKELGGHSLEVAPHKLPILSCSWRVTQVVIQGLCPCDLCGYVPGHHSGALPHGRLSGGFTDRPLSCTRLGSSLQHQVSGDWAPTIPSLPIFRFLGENSAVLALVWGGHHQLWPGAGSPSTDMGSFQGWAAPLSGPYLLLL